MRLLRKNACEFSRGMHLVCCPGVAENYPQDRPGCLNLHVCWCFATPARQDAELRNARRVFAGYVARMATEDPVVRDAYIDKCNRFNC